ncbi:heparan-alpha-glucosaminide N-acetyltransferase domain-containing protein [Actinomycetospora lutea]|uniref:heparan-alpha-glucosaminide N-acetyltransferase domain-containing protein n=1 Tax=Actinomycetospora lutea TaxID=663604 RepID=UPI002366ADF4|nr:heparan-alpha-glucosaminide N-acetyltransferase domain-containing protein [Actinomycetospora lutea]MDD7941023.1 heparan-alpha-glucosaminide N-acetyltransferase domain-containing protein [Actinomycetospora lutea]
MTTTEPPRPRTPRSPGAVTDRFPAVRPPARPQPVDPPTVTLAATPRPATVPLVATPAAAPTSRVRGIDLARGLALLGMIAAHTLPLADGDQPTLAGRLVNGPAAALFGVLAGLSVALLTGRRRLEPGTGTARRHALRLVVRGLAIGTVGLALGQAALGSIDVILTYYGLLFMLAVPLVLLSTRALAGLGAALVVIAPVTGFLLRAQLPPGELLDPSFTFLLTDPAGLLTTLLFTGAYPVWHWLAYLCVGIAVGRLRLDSTKVAAALALGGAALAAIAAASSALLLEAAGELTQVLTAPGLAPEELAALFTEGPTGVTPTTSWWWLAVTLPHSSTPFDMARTIGTSLAVLGAMLLLDRLVARWADRTPGRILSAARAPLAAAGSMTLTFYVLHVVVTGLAPASDPWVLFLAQAVVALTAGILWQRRVGRGPLETGVATLVDAVVAAPPRSTDTAARPGVVSRLRSAIAVAALLVAVAAGAGVALAFPATSDAAATSAESDTADETSGPQDPGAVPDAPGAPDPAGAADTEDPAAGGDADTGDTGDAPEPGADDDPADAG